MILRLGADSSHALESILRDLEKYGGAVIGMVPNMDRMHEHSGFAVNYVGQPLYFVFANCTEPVDPQVRVWEART